MKIKSKSDKELRKIAHDLYSNLIFTSVNVEPSILGMVFIPLSFGALSKFTKDELKDIGLLYEYFDNSLSRSINGYPSFGSVCILNISDTKTVEKYYDEIKEFNKRFLDEI